MIRYQIKIDRTWPNVVICLPLFTIVYRRLH